MKDVINDYVNGLIAAAAGDYTKFWNSIVRQSGPFFNLTGIEEWLYKNHKGDMTGVYDDRRRGFAAPCMRLCGECVGTDKIGHFFEEGYIYQQIARAKGDNKFAIGWGEWMEGKVPTDPDVLKWLQEGTWSFWWSGGYFKDVRIYDLFGTMGDASGTYNRPRP